MGGEVDQIQFEARDYVLFQQKLDQEMDFIRQLFAEKQFDNMTRKLGYEVELCLLDDSGAPAPLNDEVLSKASQPLFTYELAKYNLEINGNAFPIDSQVFNHIERDLTELYNQVGKVAENFNIQSGLFGVLPSLEHSHLNKALYMSDQHRYELLDQRLMEMRERPVQLRIQGEDFLSVEKLDVMLEAMGTSLQVHYQIPFDESVDAYHAALWASLAIIAACANSPLVLQKKGWHESRVAIFKQAVDTRNPQEVHDAIIPRVHLGRGYIKSWLELFEDNAHYSPILPDVKDVETDELYHFNLHNGTIWRWVRPILGFDGDGNYHLRLELRVTPSGPTLIDTLANMVFYTGLTEGLKLGADDLTRIPFDVLEQDFYQVAREGLCAEVSWCDGEMNSIQNLLLTKAIPVACQGINSLGIKDCDHWLNIIEQRVSTGQTGADWILDFWNKNPDSKALVRAYQEQAKLNIPVHLWPK